MTDILNATAKGCPANCYIRRHLKVVFIKKYRKVVQIVITQNNVKLLCNKQQYKALWFFPEFRQIKHPDCHNSCMKGVKAAADWAVCFSPIVCLSGDNLLLHTSCSKRKYGFLIYFRHKQMTEIRIRVVHAFSLRRINTTQWNQEWTGSGTLSPRTKCSQTIFFFFKVLFLTHTVWWCSISSSSCLMLWGVILWRLVAPSLTASVEGWSDRPGSPWRIFYCIRDASLPCIWKKNQAPLPPVLSLMCSMLADAPSCGCCINSRSLVSKPFRVSLFIRFQAGCYTSIGARNPIKRTRTHHPL